MIRLKKVLSALESWLMQVISGYEYQTMSEEDRGKNNEKLAQGTKKTRKNY